MPPPLIAVVGPVESALLAAFVDHYQGLGVNRFLLAFHFPDGTGDTVTEELMQACHVIVGKPEILSTGPWHESTNAALRDELRRRAGPGWHLIADIDEFQTYPTTISEAIEKARRSRRLVVTGLMLDRVAADGSLGSWSPGRGIDNAYPLGGFVTHRLLRADPRKIVLAHSSAPLARGNHHSPGHPGVNEPPVPVHHFKWRRGVLAYLRNRAEMFASGQWREETPAMRTEAQRVFKHLAAHGGRFHVDSPLLDLKPVSLRETPAWWTAESTAINDNWLPPHLVDGQLNRCCR
ncbi:MAG: glycosyltransferase family 2 protein [Micromonosporaceae bacterium]